MARRNENIYATGAQVFYLRRLMDEAFSRRIPTGLVIRDWDRLLKSEASLMISEIRAKLGMDKGTYTKAAR